MKMLWFWRPPPPSPPLSVSSSLLEAFVIQSALFVQLENSTGLLHANPTSPDPEVCWRHFSWIFLGIASMQPVESLSKPFILSGTLLLISSF